MQALTAGVFTFLFSLVLTFVCRSVARRTSMVAAPKPDRWHQKPTALLGGVAVFAAFMAGYAAFGMMNASTYAIVAAGSLLFFTGLVDDVVQIKPYAKLVVQLIAASMMVYFGLHLPWVEYQLINNLLTIFWLVGITNAVNLLDNMDGLAGGVSAISCAFLAVSFLMSGQTGEATLAVMLGGAALGFLVFNFNPASIFMGDCGSMFLGFMLSSVALLSNTGRFRHLTSVLLTPVLILLIPIFDTCFVTLSRKLSGRPISRGGRDHTSHRLVALGISERRAVLTLYGFAAASGLLALMVNVLETTVVLMLVPVFALSVIFLGLYLGKVRVYHDGEPAQGLRLMNVLVNFSYKRRVFEVLLDVVLVTMAYYGALVLRWDGDIPGEQFAIFITTLPVVITIQMVFLLAGGVYRGLWRYAGINDLLVITRAACAGAAVSALVVFLMYRFQGPSRAVALLHLILLVALISISRISFRLLRALLVGRMEVRPDAKPILIYGAGDGGELLIREIINNPSHPYAPVGFIDDDARKTGKLIHGYRIFNSGQLPELIRTYSINEVLVSSFKVPDSRLDYLRSLGLGLRKMSIRIE